MFCVCSGTVAGETTATGSPYRGVIQDVPEWPFTTSTYARLILYMLIPVAFWVLGVVAEEVVGRALF